MSASEAERSLINSLFEAEGYNEQIRPIKNIDDVTFVDIELTVFQILNVVRLRAITCRLVARTQHNIYTAKLLSYLVLIHHNVEWSSWKH